MSFWKYLAEWLLLRKLFEKTDKPDSSCHCPPPTRSSFDIEDCNDYNDYNDDEDMDDDTMDDFDDF